MADDHEQQPAADWFSRYAIAARRAQAFEDALRKIASEAARCRNPQSYRDFSIMAGRVARDALRGESQ